MTKYKLLDAVARQMEKNAWREYDKGNGRCANTDGWACLRSLDHAKAALLYLRDNGLLSEKAMTILKDAGEEINTN